MTIDEVIEVLEEAKREHPEGGTAEVFLCGGDLVGSIGISKRTDQVTIYPADTESDGPVALAEDATKRRETRQYRIVEPEVKRETVKVRYDLPRSEKPATGDQG